MKREDFPRRVTGPQGRWKAEPAPPTPEERQKQLDRIALGHHLIGFTARDRGFRPEP